MFGLDFFVTIGRLSSQSDDLAVREGAAVDGESDESAFFVPTLQSGGAWVDVQELEGVVVFYLQYVGVSGDE